jgi:hypothetical protein
VRATDERFLDALGPYLDPFRVTEPPESNTRYSAIVGEDRELPGGKRVTGINYLYLESLRVFRGRHRESMAGRLLSTIRDMYTAPRNEFVRLQAGSVVFGDGAVTFPSSPDRRVSTFVSFLVKRGGKLLNDAVAHLDPVLHRVHGMPIPLLISARDMDMVPELPGDKPRSGKRQELDLRPLAPEALGGALSEPRPLRWLIFPAFVPGEDSRLEAFGGAEALFGLTQACLNLNVWRDRSLGLFRHLLNEVAVSRLVVGDPDEAAALVAEAAPSMTGELSA